MSLVTIDQIHKENLLKCQKQLGYWFKDVTLLAKALTHTSRRTDFNFSNERLKFLGDSVLDLIISEYLFKTFPDNCEGELAKIKSVVVSRLVLAKVGRSLNLGSYLAISKGLANTITFPESLLANAYKAVVGATCLDRGVDAANKFVLKNLRDEINIVCKDEHKKNYKTLLQQCGQGILGGTPTYKVLQQYGRDHIKIFQIAAVINNTEYGVAWGKTKKEASQKAAYHALKAIRPDVEF
ncbi:MAG: ribonuclease III [Candidatus Anammoxibacter sp.]